MATSSQLKALVQSYAEGNEDSFYTYVMQIAAHEARVGHGKLAKELRDIIDAAKHKKEKITLSQKVLPIVQPKGELSKLLSAFYPKVRITEMILDSKIAERLNRIIKEQQQNAIIQSHGLNPRRKFLLLGPPGTGKTMTAYALAGELHFPLFVIRLDGIITKFMGETSAKLRLVFDAIKQHRGIYLFDEFDSIGTMRASMNDVGEIRRILNSFLQFIDQDDSDSLIFAATNHPQILDYALFRRFDDVIEYTLPKTEYRLKLLKNKLTAFCKTNFNWDKLAVESERLSYAEINRACEDSMKDTIINHRETISQKSIVQMLKERRKYHSKIYNNPHNQNK
ncbi:MAG: AAA family ATPase [Candidatus Anammoxibacter sp.]